MPKALKPIVWARDWEGDCGGEEVVEAEVGAGAGADIVGLEAGRGGVRVGVVVRGRWWENRGWWGRDSLGRSVMSVKVDGGEALAKENPETIGIDLIEVSSSNHDSKIFTDLTYGEVPWLKIDTECFRYRYFYLKSVLPPMSHLRHCSRNYIRKSTFPIPVLLRRFYPH